ncbi:MAG: Fe-S cluster assembly protein SufD [Hyphomicrobiaceae bacterium]|nr:MAG: Fe-S cluster assembly protein SufD [Hyphomicrobiaceae bacterium]
MTVQIAKTKAETGLLESFGKVAGNLPGTPAVRALREAAIGRFAALGLPHRRIEEWKFTDLRAAVKEALPPARLDKGAYEEEALAKALGRELAGLTCIQLVFVDGEFLKAEMPASQAPGEAYQFDNLGHGLSSRGFEWIERHLEADKGPAAAIAALNTAFVTDGALLRIADGQDMKLPIHLVFLSTGASPASTATRNLIRIGRGAKCTILESHIAAGGAAHLDNAMTAIEAEDGASVRHVKVLVAGAAGTHLGTTHVRLGRDVSYRLFQMTTDSALVRNEIAVTFAGKGSSIDLSGAFLARGSAHIDTTLLVDHAVAGCKSRELFKGVLDGRARGVFQGKVIVRPDAQKSDGKQMAQVLMLSPDTEFDSKPELEIYADDVVCGHGSTAAEIDEDLLFYCRSRGIPQKEARALLIESFVGEALEKVEDEDIRAALMARANAWLAAEQEDAST